MKPEDVIDLENPGDLPGDNLLLLDDLLLSGEGGGFRYGFEVLDLDGPAVSPRAGLLGQIEARVQGTKTAVAASSTTAAAATSQASVAPASDSASTDASYAAQFSVEAWITGQIAQVDGGGAGDDGLDQGAAIPEASGEEAADESGQAVVDGQLDETGVGADGIVIEDPLAGDFTDESGGESSDPDAEGQSGATEAVADVEPEADFEASAGVAAETDSSADDSEAITSVVVAGVPSGAVLSAGTDNEDGTWTLTAAQLSGLTIRPPADSSDDITLTVTATTTDTDPDMGAQTTATTTDTIAVTVASVADAPTLDVSAASGSEDAAIALSIAPSVTDTDGTEAITSVVVAGVPSGAVLSAGTDNGNGTWTLTGAQLTGLTITPPANSDADFSLTVTATTTDTDPDTGAQTTATTTDTIAVAVAVAGVADAPTLSASDTLSARGAGGGTIFDLDIDTALTDTDGSESLSVTVAGVPSDATLSAGTNNGDGTWTLATSDLGDLTLTVGSTVSADFSLTVTATSTDTGGDTAATSTTIGVALNHGVTLAGGSGDDTLTGGGLYDTITGGAGDDTLVGGDGSDYLVGDVAPPPMYVMDAGSDSILMVSFGGRVSEVAVSEAEIMAATGKDSANLQDRGIAVDDAGNIFFTDAKPDSILMKPADGGALEVIATKNDIKDVTGAKGADPKSIAIGSDGKLYVADDSSDGILRIDPTTGNVTEVVTDNVLEGLPGIGSVDLDGGIVAAPNGMLYVPSDGSPQAIFAIDTATGDASVLASGTPFSDIDVFMTLAPNGDLIVADDVNDTIFKVDVDTGDVSVFLSESDLETLKGGEVDIQGGISFDSEGNFYVAEENGDDVFM